MPFVTLGLPNHDTIPGVSAADHHAATVAGDLNHQDLANRSATDHHTATVAGDLNLADLAERLHASLSDLTANNHHAAVHIIPSHGDTSATGAELNTLTDGSNASSLHVHLGELTARCIAGITGNIIASFGVTSVTDEGTGQILFDLLPDEASDDYTAMVTIESASALYCNVAAQNPGSFDAACFDAAGAAADPVFWMMHVMGI